MNLEKFIAGRYLRSPRKDRSISVITKISIIGVAIGVMTLIVSLSIMNGFERDLKSALKGVNGDLTLYSLSLDGFVWEQDDDLINLIKSVVDIKGYSPFIQHQALIMGKRKPMGTIVKAIDALKEPEVTPINSFVRTESFEVKRDNTKLHREIDEEERKKSKGILSGLTPHYETITASNGVKLKKKTRGIIIGSQLARDLGVKINDWITLISLETRVTAVGEMPRAKRFKVTGFFESGIMGYDETISLIDINIAQKLFKMPNEISGLTLRLKDSRLADQCKKKLQKVLKFPFVINTWSDQNKNLFAIFRLEKLGLAIILTLIILVAAFNIISSLVMLVIEKNKDIAILKAMGATDRSISKIFIWQGTVIGLIGTIIGEVLGLIVCWVINNFDIIDLPSGVYVGNRIPMHVETWQVLLIAFISFLICFIVTVFPSRKAAALEPAEVLRHQV